MSQGPKEFAEAEVCARAVTQVESHFQLLNDGDSGAAKAQLFSPPGVDLAPLDVYVRTMSLLTPFQLHAVTVKRIEPPHRKRHGVVAAVWVSVDLTCALGRRQADIVVWWFQESGEYLISARPSEWVLEKLRGPRKEP